MTAADVASQTDQVSALVLSAATAFVMAIGAIFAGIMAKRAKSTNEAVYDDQGRSVSDALVAVERRLTSRIDQNDARLTDQARRVGATEASTAEAHRRIDTLEDTYRDSTRAIGERLGAVEQEVAVIKGAPCMGTSDP